MPSLFLSEYPPENNLAEPALAHQVVELTEEGVLSTPFTERTRLVRAHADAACMLTFGADPDPNASGTYLPAGGTQVFGVRPPNKVAVRLVAPKVAAMDDLWALLRVIGDPSAAREAAAQLQKLNDEAKANMADAKAKLAAAEEKEKATASREAELRKAQSALVAAQRDLKNREDALRQQIQAHSEVAAKHQEQAEKFERVVKAIHDDLAERRAIHERDFEERNSEISVREKTLTEHEAEIAAREAVLQQAEQRQRERESKFRDLMA